MQELLSMKLLCSRMHVCYLDNTEWLLEYLSYIMEQTPWGDGDRKRKTKGITKVVHDIFSRVHNPDLTIKKIKHTNNNRNYGDTIPLEERLSISKIFMVFFNVLIFFFNVKQNIHAN